jgi:hypothetical protein
MLRAAGIDDPDDEDDVDLLAEASPRRSAWSTDPGLPADEAAAIMTLELADWAGAVIGLVRGGPGAPADPASLVPTPRRSRRSTPTPSIRTSAT